MSLKRPNNIKLERWNSIGSDPRIYFDNQLWKMFAIFWKWHQCQKKWLQPRNPGAEAKQYKMEEHFSHFCEEYNSMDDMCYLKNICKNEIALISLYILDSRRNRELRNEDGNFASIEVNFKLTMLGLFLAELSRAKRASGATWVRKGSNLPIRENLVITWPYTDRPPARATVRPHHRHTNVNNSINRYGNPMQLEVILAGNRIATGVL